MKSWKNQKILAYNPRAVKQLIYDFRRLNIIKEDVTDEYIDMFYHPQSLVAPPAHFIHDRNDIIPHFLPMKKGVAPWPRLHTNPSDFGSSCQQRAWELLDQGKVINVWWSGGLDSTTVLVTLMSLAEDPQQIRVLCSPDSIVESGAFFDRFIKHSGVQYHISDLMHKKRYFQLWESVFGDDDIFTDGGLADQVYGKQLFYDPHWVPELLDKPWDEALEQVSGQKIIDFVRPAIEVAPIKVKLYREFLWYYKNNFAWHCHKFMNQVNNPPKYLKKTQKFFDSDILLSWAAVNGPGIIEEQPDKLPQRLWIYELTGFAEYSFLKPRYRSSGNTLYKDWCLMIEDGRSLSYRDVVLNGEVYDCD